VSKVLSLKESNFTGGDGTEVICWKVELDDKTNPVPCYSAEAGKLTIGEPLPAGWEVKTSAKGKDYLALPKAPKGGGGGFAAAFRNSEEGQKREQDSIHRSVALTQAVAEFPGCSFDEVTKLLQVAERFYEWLSGAAPAASDKGDGAVATSSPPTSSPKQVMDGHGEEEVDGGVGVDGEDTPAPPKAHEHQWIPSPRLKSFDVCVVEGCYETKKRLVKV
jgi:hypothetical protein